MFKKAIRLSIVFATVLFLAACGISTTQSPTTTANNATTTTTATGSTTTTDVVTTLREFTLNELAQYNGNNGSTAYIAVSGTVYDVTHESDWSNGWHKGVHYAGTDCTAAFADSPHAPSWLNQLTIVGTLA